MRGCVSENAKQCLHEVGEERKRCVRNRVRCGVTAKWEAEEKSEDKERNECGSAEGEVSQRKVGPEENKSQ